LKQATTNFYFPTAKWCDVYCKGSTSESCCIDATAGGVTKSLDTLYAFQAYLHIRSGHVVPMQDAVYLAKYLYNTTATE